MKLSSNKSFLFKKLNKSTAKELGNFSAIFLIERILTGFLPLGLLYLSNESVYNRLEFIFSLATIMLPFSDLMARIYFFYGYAESKQKEDFIKVSFSIFCSQLMLIILSSIFSLLLNEKDLFYAITRLAYLSLYFFLFDYLRIENKQDYLIRDSIVINCSILLFATIDHLLIHSNLLFPFIATIQLGYIFYRLKDERKLFTVLPINKAFAFFKKSLHYSFPVFINVSIAVFVQNYLKVHFYKTDNEQAMLVLSLLLRLGLSIQIIHALLQSYFAKKIFLKEISFNNFFTSLYLPLIILAAFGLSLAEVIYFNYSDRSIQVENTIIIFVNLYFLFWCTSAIMEILFTSRNRNIWLLLINILSLLCTFTGLYSFDFTQTTQLSRLISLMFVQPALFIIFTGLLYKRIFPKNDLIANGV